MLRFVEVRPAGGHVVEALLTDGSTRIIDLDPWLSGAIFEEIRSNEEAFSRVHVDEISRTLAWPDGLHLDPDVLLDPEWVASVSEMTGRRE